MYQIVKSMVPYRQMDVNTLVPIRGKLVPILKMQEGKVGAGDRLRVLRDARGLKQRELGKLIGVSHAAISRWESGERGISSELIPKLASVLRVQCADFFADAECSEYPKFASTTTRQTTGATSKSTVESRTIGPLSEAELARSVVDDLETLPPADRRL